MRLIKTLILLLSIVLVANCGGGGSSDPKVQVFVDNFVEEGVPEKDAYCLVMGMKNSMPDDLWNSYYDLMMSDGDSDDMEALGEMMEVGFAALPFVMASAAECGVDLDM